MHDRLTLLRERMREMKINAFLISSLSNLRYMFGFTGSNGIALVTPDRCLFVTDLRYSEQVKHEIRDAEVCIAVQDLFEPLKADNLLQDGSRLGFEAAHLYFRSFSNLRNSFQKVKLVGTEYVLEKITAAKLPSEVDRIREACQISKKVWHEVLQMIRPGITELDVAAEISYRARKHGADGDAFEPIVASGWRSALPHGLASRKKLEHGELVVIDFGCSRDGFNADITRTISIGDPTTQQRHMYETVKEANRLAVAAIKPGMPAIDLDKVARDYLATQGFEKEFSHSLGHGLGIDVHSLPRIGLRSKDTIPVDSVITIEPGVYLPDVGGVRIEDDVYVGPEQSEILTPIERDLIVIE